MTSRERLLNAIKLKPYDRVPICTYELCGYDFDTWYNNEPSYKRLMDYIREKTDCVLMFDHDYLRVPLQECEVKEHKEGISTFQTTVLHTKFGDLTQNTRVDDNVKTVWVTEHFLKDIDDVDKYLSLPYEVPKMDFTNFYKKQTGLGENGIMMTTFSDPICDIADLFGMEELLVNILTETEKMQYFLDIIFERKVAELDTLLQYDVKDVLFRLVGAEYATPPYVQHDLYYDFVTKYLKVFTEKIHSRGGLVRIHSHGKIATVIDQLVSTGCNALDPCEPLPAGDMSLSDIKKLYGDKICVFGNIELFELETSNSDKVYNLTRDVMEIGKVGGKFVLMPTATPINIPLAPKTEENFIAMIDAGIEFGR